MQDTIERYYQHNPPYGERWVWMGNDMVVIDAALTDTERDAAFLEALDDLRDRALGRPVGLTAAVA